MENAYLILAILVLLFISMYGYSYIPVILESRKLKQLKIEQAQLEQEQVGAIKEDFIDDKLSKSLKRSAEIKMELERLQQIKINKMNLLDDELNRMKVEKMKKQQVS